MLTSSQLRFFLETISHTEKHTPEILLGLCSKLLATELILETPDGKTIYHAKGSKPSNHRFKTKVFTITHKNKALGILLVCKSTLDINEQILLEMLTGILICSLKQRSVTNSNIPIYA